MELTKSRAAPAASGQVGGGYPMVDAFRLVAALLVVAIHTAPLASVSPPADFVLNRVVARLAVPFFFMASGFFLVKSKKPRPLRAFVLKILAMYGLCILLYLPLNLYKGDFAASGLVSRLVRDLVWNGTVYHLWYFPAVALGAAIAWPLYRRLPLPAGIGIAAALYLVGLGGDNWYGVAVQLPGAQAFYGGLFRVFDYTRNGLLFAPLFLLCGMALAARQRPVRRGLATLGLAVGLAALLGEALWLRQLGGGRHESMYLALPLCSVCLFALLASRQGRPLPGVRSLAGGVFIWHPWCIVMVRGAAGLLDAKALLVDNSPVFYLCVCGLSLALTWAAARLPKPPFKKGEGPRNGTEAGKTQSPAGRPGAEGDKITARRQPPPNTRAWVEVDEAAIRHNLGQLQSLLAPKARVMAVVKDEAYGHGAVHTARLLQSCGVKAFAVATLEEGVALRRCGVGGTVLVLGYTPPAAAIKLWFWRLTQTAVDEAHARALSAQRWPVRVHVKVDTGMHRLGTPAWDAAAICRIYALPHIKVKGIFTHLARADSDTPADRRFTAAQIDAWHNLLEKLGQAGVEVGKTHLHSSYGLLNSPELPGDYARVGLALYGVRETPTKPYLAALPLRPALSLRAVVASVRRVPAGQWVGYGHGWQCERDALVATVTIGYGDGLPRGAKGAHVLLHGRRVPVIGTLCMDQLSVCVDDVPQTAPGDVATLIGRDGEACIGVEEWAQQGGGIANELLARMGGRIQRVYLAGKVPDAQGKSRVALQPARRKPRGKSRRGTRRTRPVPPVENGGGLVVYCDRCFTAQQGPMPGRMCDKTQRRQWSCRGNMLYLPPTMN